MLYISDYLSIIMRMNIATDAPMERFLNYLLAHPERFARCEVPCCLQALWQEALEEQPRPGLSPQCTAPHHWEGMRVPSNSVRPYSNGFARPAFLAFPTRP